MGSDFTPVRAVPTATRRPAARIGSRLRYSTDRPAAEIRTSLDTQVGNAIASSAPMKPPIELPTTIGASTSSAWHSASTTRANPWMEIRPAGISERPKPGRSGAITRCDPMNAGMLSSQFCHMPASPWMNRIGWFAPPVSTTLTRRPSTSTVRVSAGQSSCLQVESSPSAYVSSAPGRASACPAAALTCSGNPGTPLPYRPRMPRAELPAPDPRRAYLPAIEPERQVTDWGRSERVEGAMDKALYTFLYHYWFRVEVEGMEHVPSTGGALLVSNHAGALPPAAPMIAKAIKEEHPRPRPLHLTVEHFFKGYPGLSMLIAKIGGVPAHPANVHRLLKDEEQLVLVFPEGRKGTEKLYKDRYRLRRFGRGGFVEAAMRAKAPIVPVAVVGAEEAAPIFAHLGPLAKLTGLTYFPITPTFPHFGLLGMAGYLPAKFKIRFLPPVRTDDMGDAPWEDAGLVQTVAEDIRSLIQDELYGMLAKRRSIWLG